MQYLVKTAIGLYEENDIDTYEKFEQYTERRRTVDDGVSKLRKLLGIGDRALTTNESQFTEIWFAQREYPFELVRYAYELTVDKLGKYNMKYMNAILDRWHEEGIVNAGTRRSRYGGVSRRRRRATATILLISTSLPRSPWNASSERTGAFKKWKFLKRSTPPTP